MALRVDISQKEASTMVNRMVDMRSQDLQRTADHQAGSARDVALEILRDRRRPPAPVAGPPDMPKLEPETPPGMTSHRASRPNPGLQSAMGSAPDKFKPLTQTGSPSTPPGYGKKKAGFPFSPSGPPNPYGSARKLKPPKTPAAPKGAFMKPAIKVPKPRGGAMRLRGGAGRAPRGVPRAARLPPAVVPVRHKPDSVLINQEVATARWGWWHPKEKKRIAVASRISPNPLQSVL